MTAVTRPVGEPLGNGRDARSPRPAAAPAPAADDEALLRRIAEGDQAAFRCLVERHMDRAFGLALRILGSRADAEDVVQDVLVKVWQTRGRWDFGKARFTTWLYRVVTNRCIDLVRRPRTEALDGVPDPVDGAFAADSRLIRSEASLALEGALARLPEQQRIAIVLSYHEDLSNAEVAAVMSTTVAAVESLLKRGRASLREILRRSAGDVLRSLSED